MADIDSIYTDIIARSCILIIGPDLFENDPNAGFYEKFITYAKEQKEKNPQQWADVSKDQLDSLFDDDGFSNIPNTWILGKISKQLQQFCSAYAEKHDEFYKKLARIPFHLIFLITPDISLVRVYKKLGLNYNFYSYHPAESTQRWESVNTFSESDQPPLLISLLTQYDENKNKVDEVVLSYDNFIAFISYIYGQNPLPDPVLADINSADQIILLGYRFNKWYGKLMCDLFHFPRPEVADKRKLRKRTMAVLTKNGESEPFDFYTRHYETHFEYCGTEEFIDQLYEKCRKEGKLRSVSNEGNGSPRALASQIKSLATRDIDKAVTKLDELGQYYPAPHPYDNAIGHIKGVYNDARRSQNINPSSSRGIGLALPEDKSSEIREMIFTLVNEILQE